MAPTSAPPIRERSEYLKRVLSPALNHGTRPDLFTRYGLDPNEDDQQVIAQQLDYVLKLWRNITSHEKYGGVVRQLLKEHPEAERILKDHSRREEVRAEALRERATPDRARVEKFDSLIKELRDGDGALPESSRENLARAGAACGLSPEEVTVRLAKERFFDDVGKQRLAMDQAKYDAIMENLRAVRALGASGLDGRTLFSLIGATFSASRSIVNNAYEEARKRKAARPYGDEKTHVSRVLVDVRRYLIDGDPDLYRNAVVREAKEALAQEIRLRKEVRDQLDTAGVEALVQEAVGSGLDHKWANVAVREAARAERMAIQADRIETAPRPAMPQPPIAPPRPSQQSPPAPPGPPVPPRTVPPAPPAGAGDSTATGKGQRRRRSRWLAALPVIALAAVIVLSQSASLHQSLTRSRYAAPPSVLNASVLRSAEVPGNFKPEDPSGFGSIFVLDNPACGLSNHETVSANVTNSSVERAWGDQFTGGAILSQTFSFSAGGAKRYLDALASAARACHANDLRLDQGRSVLGLPTLRLHTDNISFSTDVLLVRVGDSIAGVADVESGYPSHFQLLDRLAAISVKRLQAHG